MIGPPSTSVTSQGPSNGNAAHNRRSDSQSPIGILVEPHHLSRKAHGECHQEKEDAEYPSQFTRVFIGAEEEDLSHVDQDNGDHEVRTPAMQGSNEPSERDAVIESLQAVPSLSGGRHVNQRKKNAGDDLKEENGERGATEDIKPTRGIAGHRVLDRFANCRAKLEAMVEPGADCSDQAHGGLTPFVFAVGLPVVGISPPLMRSFPSSIL